MRRLIALILILAMISGLGFYVLKRYLPNLMPPSKNIKQFLPLNKDTPSPLIISNDYKMDILYDMKGELPKFMNFDENGVLFVSTSNTGKIYAFPNGEQKQVLSGVRNSKGFIFKADNFYIIEKNGLYKYLYDESSHSLIDKRLIISFDKPNALTPDRIQVLNNKIYLLDNENVLVFDFDGNEIAQDEYSKKDIFLVSDINNNVYEILDNKIIMYRFFAGSINNEKNIVSGFTQENGELIGNILDVVVNKENNLLVTDNKNGLIYILTK